MSSHHLIMLTVTLSPPPLLLEAENRLHIMIDILAYIPAKHIQICFMNNVDTILTLSHNGKTPEDFQNEYHHLVRTTFNSLRLGGTPTLATLKRGFAEAARYDDPTSHYLLTDGVPTDASIGEVSQLIQERRNPKRNPLTLISCTNEDSECEWMKIVSHFLLDLLLLLIFVPLCSALTHSLSLSLLSVSLSVDRRVGSLHCRN
jgi:hypothetical protein